MSITITDACIFIDLYDLELIPQFFNLDLEIHTSKDVYEELYDYQQKKLGEFIELGKLTIHILRDEDWIELSKASFPRSLSINDQTVLYLAGKLNALVLSSDNLVRKIAKANMIDYHGMLWVLDELLRLKIIDNKVASGKLQLLISRNQTYQNNPKLVHEMQNRLRNWQDL